jgi:Undecaprenyl-phosphate glucose phosphotransferase
VFDSVHKPISPQALRFSRFVFTHVSLAAVAFLFEFTGIVLTAISTGLVYHFTVYGGAGPTETYAAIGILTGLGYGLAFLIRDEYSIESLLQGPRNSGRIVFVWSFVFVGLAAIGFLTKTTHDFSRGWLVLFYVFGVAIVLLLNTALNRILTHLIARGWVHRRKLMLVATDVDLAAMDCEISGDMVGFHIAARVALPHVAASPEEIDDALRAAVDNARAIGIEDVLISSALSGPDFLERAVNAFSMLPVAIHLSAGGLIGQFKDARVARFGGTAALSLTRPLRPFEAAAKRWFDVVVSATALLLLSPLLGLIALLIKLDSPGPIFFKQRRRGYNSAEFRIWKFRTMTTLDDGDMVKQATREDERITRIGKLLRRTSLDELPQLINVLKGEMSLVGPRPHAVAHDRIFEKRFADYPRRLNVKPGITGWAQVNGFRGEIKTDEAMRQRIDHDLYYIDNWSIGFDLYILLLTLVSPRTRRNAH